MPSPSLTDMTVGPLRIHPGPVPVLPIRRYASWPLHGVAATREVETTALSTEPGGALMRRAGRTVARWAMALQPHARRWWIAAGPGGNGGDGAYAAAQLARRGLDVCLTLYTDAHRLPADAARGIEAARQAGVVITPAPRFAQSPDAVIDALLGIGTRRAPSGALAEGLRAIGTTAAPCLSIDLPSGLDADTGKLHGEQAVISHATLSLLTLKPGLFTGVGRRHAGQVWFDSLGWETPWGLEYSAPGPMALLLGAAAAQPAWWTRSHEQHKGHFGDAVVVGGAPGMSGAARLAAHAALAAGAGRTIVVLLDAAVPAGDPLRPELMHRAMSALSDPDGLSRATVICGCGGGFAVADALPAVLGSAGRLVLDADALNAIAGQAALQTMLARRADADQPTIMTPHPLEAARMLRRSVAEVQADRLQAASDLSTRWRCTVVLKGSGTVVSTPGLTPAISPTGGPALATAGTGDVLAGWIGGLWAQAPQAASSVTATAHEAACAGVWQHGHAAQQAFEGVPAARALDLIEAMRSAGRCAGPRDDQASRQA